MTRSALLPASVRLPQAAATLGLLTFGCGTAPKLPPPRPRPAVAHTAPPPAPPEPPARCTPLPTLGPVALVSGPRGLAAACDAGRVTVLLDQGRVIELPALGTAPEDEKIELVWSPDRTQLAVLRSDGVALWSESGGLLSQRLHTHAERFPGVAFHPRRPWIATFDMAVLGDQDGSTKRGVSVFDTSTGALVAQLPDVGVVQQVTWDRTNDDQLFVAGGAFSFGNFWGWGDDSVRVWSVAKKNVVARLAGHTLTASADGLVLAVGHGNRRHGGRDAMGMEVTGATITFHDARTLRRIASVPGSLEALGYDGKKAVIDPSARGCDDFRLWQLKAPAGANLDRLAEGTPCVKAWDVEGERWAARGDDGVTITTRGGASLLVPASSSLDATELHGDVLLLNGPTSDVFPERFVHHVSSQRRAQILVDGTTSCELAVFEAASGWFEGSASAVQRATCDLHDAPPSQLHAGLLDEIVGGHR